MKVKVRNRPSFAAIFVTLKSGESIIAEAGAMASRDTAIEMKTRWNGGFRGALMRNWFGGESVFVNEFSCPADMKSAEIVLSQETPGDIVQVDLDGNAIFVQPGGFIACAPEVKMGVNWAGFASWWGGEGLFRLRLSGHGPVWIGAYGGIFERDLDGEMVVDTGHLLAYSPGITISAGLASAGLFSSFFSGEGFISRLRGRGKVWLQSRSIEGLASWTNGKLY